MKRYLLSKSCAFGLIGNLTSKEGSTFVYGAGAAGPHAITSAGSDTFTYDLNGNMLQHVGGGITRNFEYDIENRLKTYKHGTSTIATYAYDYSGQRIKKTVSQSGITTRFAGQLYEEDNTGAEYQHVFAGNTRVATIAPLGVQFYYGDHLGSRSVVTDSDGLEVDHIDYKPFGEINRHDAVASEEGHHFTDQYRDDETALYYYGARYYNPKIGRFITADWVVPGPGNPQAFNRYAYTLNNPINRIDPSGNASEYVGLSDGLGNAVWGTSPLNLPKGYSLTESLDNLQFGLGIAGLSEPYGFAFDLLDAGISAVRGNTFGVGVGLLSTVPIAGSYFRSADLVGTASKGLSEGANFAQKNYRETFSAEGQKHLSNIAGTSVKIIDDLSNAIRSGAVDPKSITINTIVRDNNTLILNTRTVQALERAGVPRSSFNVSNKTGDRFYEGLLDQQLQRSNLTVQGIPKVQSRGQ